jgi:hypothetical protein
MTATRGSVRSTRPDGSPTGTFDNGVKRALYTKAGADNNVVKRA